MTNPLSSDSAPSRRPGGTPSTHASGAVESPQEDPHAALERAFIDEFLSARGHTVGSLAALPPDAMAALLRSAVAHATLRLTEIEARAHYIAELHS